MESGLTRDGRATTVSHTRFGGARRPPAVLFPLYLGASQLPTVEYDVFSPAPPGLPRRCAVFRCMHRAPGARRNRAGSERPYTKVRRHRRVKALFARRPPWPVRACRRTHRGLLPPCAHAVTEHPHFYGIGHPDEKRTCPSAGRTSVFPFHHAPCGDAVRDADALQRRVESSGGVCYLLTYGGGLNAPAASSRLVRE